MGERLDVPREIQDLMRETGTLHLMAISGLHIALAASLAWLLARGIQFLLPSHWINGKCLFWPGCALPLSTPGLPVCSLLRYARSSRLLCLQCYGSLPGNGLLAGMGLLYRGDPDKRSLSHTLAESALVCICCRRADFLVSVAASSWLAPGTTYTAAAEPDLSAGRHADAADAATGSDFPWFQHLLPGRESLCHSPGDVCLRAADPARHAASSAAAGGT